jgi:hypothetical protein
MQLVDLLIMLVPCAVILGAVRLLPAIKCPGCESSSWAFSGHKKRCLHCGTWFV